MHKTVVYGLPLNPRHLLQQLAGSSFCVSYATRKKLGKQLDQAIALVGSVENQILLVDNGAFSAWQAGVNTMSDEAYLEGFARWANRITKRCPQAIVVLPDVIDGDANDNCALAWKTWQMLDAHDRAMPCWHMHETLDYLIHLCEHFGYVAIGSSAQYAEVGSPAWKGRIAEVFEILDLWEQHTGKQRPRLHMMRGINELANYPFDSADSINVGRNHNRHRKTHKITENHVKHMADRINDRVQASAGEKAPHQVANALENMKPYNDFDCADLFTELGFEVGVIGPDGQSIKRSMVGKTEWTRLLAWCDRTELADLQNDRDGIDFVGPVFVDCDDEVKDALRKYSNDDLSDIFARAIAA